MFLILVISFIIGLIGFWYYNYFYYYGYLKQIPSPSHWPLLGNALHFPDANKFLVVIMDKMKELKTKTVRIHLPTETLVVTKDYNLIEHILSSSNLINKGFQYDFFQNWLGISVFTSAGQQWRSKRKMLTPTFHFQILEQFHDVFNANAAILIKRLRNKVDVSSFDVCPFITLCTLDIICETAMGTSINAQLEEDSSYVQAINKLGEMLPLRIVNPFYHNNFIYQFTALGRKEQQLLETVHGYNNSMIKNRRENFLKEQAEATNLPTDDLGRKKKVPFLDLLLQTTVDNGVPLTDAEIANEVATFMLAGHDTTSVALSYALFLLGNHKEEQDKAFEELRDIFGDDTQRFSTLDDIQRMKYLELVIKETLRLYPSAPLFTRKIYEEFTVDGITYPKGLTVTILAYGVHHDENNYENAELFDPERFSKERTDGKRPYAFIPFSAGPRNCIGQKYAMLELKTLLSCILRNFEVMPSEPPHTLELTPHVTLKSSNGVEIKLAERSY